MTKGRPRKAEHRPPVIRLKELREALGWSQEKLSEVSGLGLSTISRLETGEYRVKEEHVIVLHQALGCHPGELFAPITMTDDKSMQDWLDVGRKLPPEKREIAAKLFDPQGDDGTGKGRRRKAS